MEVWKDIPNWAVRYQASSKGRVRNAKTGRVLKGMDNRRGYLRVCMPWGNKTGWRPFGVHRLIAMAFHGNPPDDRPYTRHLDGNPKNNIPGNLKWGSHLENEEDKETHGTRPRGESTGNALLTVEEVIEIRAAKRKRWLLYELAERYGVSRFTIRAIRKRQLWTWLKEAK